MLYLQKIIVKENFMQIPKQSVKYISLQRTGYLEDNLVYKFLTKIENKRPFYLLISTKLKEVFFFERIKDQFTNDIESEFKTLIPFLPNKASNILDIGSGIGLINIHLYEYFGRDTNIHLLDKTEVEDKLYYGFNHERTPFYNSLNLAKSILMKNNVAEENIFIHEVGDHNSCFQANKFDLVTSYISLGFHYPISTYIDEILLSIKADGILILDIRKNTTQLDEIKKKFNTVTVISEKSKHMRIAAKNPIYK